MNKGVDLSQPLESPNQSKLYIFFEAVRAQWPDSLHPSLNEIFSIMSEVTDRLRQCIHLDSALRNEIARRHQEFFRQTIFRVCEKNPAILDEQLRKLFEEVLQEIPDGSSLPPFSI